MMTIDPPVVSDRAIRLRVARGAGWLDGVYPDWFRDIDPETLDIASACNCVLAQCGPRLINTEHRMEFGISPSARVCDYGIPLLYFDFDSRWAYRHAFEGGSYALIGGSRRSTREITAINVTLRKLWLREVDRRLAQAGGDA